MRCRPGDLCIIIRAHCSSALENVGTFIRVIDADGDSQWTFEKASRPLTINFYGKILRVNHSFEHLPDFVPLGSYLTKTSGRFARLARCCPCLSTVVLSSRSYHE